MLINGLIVHFEYFSVRFVFILKYIMSHSLSKKLEEFQDLDPSESFP